MMIMKIFDEHDHLGTSRLPARSLAVGLFVVAAGFLTVVLLNVGTLAVFLFLFLFLFLFV